MPKENAIFHYFFFLFSRGNQEGLYISKLSFSFGEGGLFRDEALLVARGEKEVGSYFAGK